MVDAVECGTPAKSGWMRPHVGWVPVVQRTVDQLEHDARRWRRGRLPTETRRGCSRRRRRQFDVEFLHRTRSHRTRPSRRSQSKLCTDIIMWRRIGETFKCGSGAMRYATDTIDGVKVTFHLVYDTRGNGCLARAEKLTDSRLNLLHGTTPWKNKEQQVFFSFCVLQRARKLLGKSRKWPHQHQDCLQWLPPGQFLMSYIVFFIFSY